MGTAHASLYGLKAFRPPSCEAKGLHALNPFLPTPSPYPHPSPTPQAFATRLDLIWFELRERLCVC